MDPCNRKLPGRIACRIAVVLFFLVTSGNAASHAINLIYVDADATGLADGSSWADAFTDLQDALDVARAGDEIWVADGVYKPDRGTGDRNLTFQMVCGAAIYGGFEGTETCRDERDWVAFRTILDGDLNDDDGAPNCEESSNCCVTHEEPGCDDALCEAMVCAQEPFCCELSDLSWRESCAYRARAICCHLGDWNACENSRHVMTVPGCQAQTIIDGVTVLGGYHEWVRDWDPPEIVELYGFSGSGIRSIDSNLVIRNSRFEGSYLRDIKEESDSSNTEITTIEIVSSTFEHQGLGLGPSLGIGNATIVDSNFLGNARLELGGGTLPDRRTHKVQNCRFVGIGAIIRGNSTIEDCLFQDSSGTGLQLLDGTPTVRNSTFVGNRSHLRFTSASGFVDNCLLVGSTLDTVSGGGGSVLFRNSSLLFNSPTRSAISWGGGSVLLLNTTVVGNGLQQNRGAGGIELGLNGSAQLLNSILWGNGSGAMGNTPEENQINLGHGAGTLEIDYSIIEGWSGKFGGPGNTGNFGLDPMFADLDGSDDVPGTLDDNARLLPGSPAINAGFGSSQFQLPTDLDGHARVLCSAVDIGAYEFGFGDFNCDQSVNMTDFVMWPFCMTGPADGDPAKEILLPGCEAFDANADGDIDLADYPVVENALMDN